MNYTSIILIIVCLYAVYTQVSSVIHDFKTPIKAVVTKWLQTPNGYWDQVGEAYTGENYMDVVSAYKVNTNEYDVVVVNKNIHVSLILNDKHPRKNIKRLYEMQDFPNLIIHCLVGTIFNIIDLIIGPVALVLSRLPFIGDSCILTLSLLYQFVHLLLYVTIGYPLFMIYFLIILLTTSIKA